ncbi:MAG: hypothetical protein KIG85_02980, partial [Thiopseudomonas sp.]|nr:hypothetical protein [Thiopseudomonas sp.]
TLKRLRSGNTNTSDVAGGVLLRNNIHIAVCAENAVSETLTSLANSPATSKAKAKFILATDGVTLEAEDLNSGETVACNYADVADHFGVFLPLAGISTLKEIKDNPIDVRATGRLNKLYVELLDDNPEWALAERRCDMNHFMARLIFCFFAEDTDIFTGDDLFTKTVDQVSERDGSNTDARVLGATLKMGDTLEYNFSSPERYGYLVAAKGKIDINGQQFNARDGAAIHQEEKIIITALEEAELVLVDAS